MHGPLRPKMAFKLGEPHPPSQSFCAVKSSTLCDTIQRRRLRLESLSAPGALQ